MKNIMLSALMLLSVSVYADCTQIHSTLNPVMCEFNTLQVITAQATELRTWPGTQFNYSKAYKSWEAADTVLTWDISRAALDYSEFQAGAATEEISLKDLHADVILNLNNLNKHISEYSERGFVDKSDKNKVIAQSNKIIRMLEKK